MNRMQYLILAYSSVQHDQFCHAHGLSPFTWRRVYAEDSWRGLDPERATLLILPDGRLQRESGSEVIRYWMQRDGKVIWLTEEQARGQHSLFYGQP